MTERIGDLSLEHAAPAGRPRSRSVLFVHGMWGGSWYFHNYLHAAAQAGTVGPNFSHLPNAQPAGAAMLV